MPHLEITNIANDDIANIREVMLFPSDANNRKKYHLINQIKHDLNNNSDVKDFLMTRADIELLLDCPSSNSWDKLIADHAKKACIAGDLAAIIYAMNIFNFPEPSMNKAIHVSKKFASPEYGEFADGTRLPISEQTIRNCWNEYKSVAHLWGALRLCSDYENRKISEIITENEYIHFLQVAAGILKLGRELVLRRQKAKTPLFSANEMWKLPANIEPLKLVAEDYPEFLKTLLTDYKAPINNSY